MDIDQSLPKLPVSVLLLSQNSSKSISRTLESLKDFAEIVVIDGGSTDNTQEIVAQYDNTIFISHAWEGFLIQRNFSLTKAKYDWCFMIDSDEACTPEVAQEMRKVLLLKDPKILYRIVRTEYFLGDAVESGHGRSDYQERFFQKKYIKYTGGTHHQHLINNQLVGPEHADTQNFPRDIRIKHDENYSMDDIIKKMPRFSIFIAKEKMAKGKTTNFALVLLAFAGTFFQIYAKSFKDGRRGFITAILTACHRGLVKLYIYQATTIKHDGKPANKSHKEQKYNYLG